MTDTAKMLARAVLADDEAAVAGLIDHLLAEVDLRAAREWLALWDGFATAYAASGEYHQDAYMVADSLMAERIKRLAARNK